MSRVLIAMGSDSTVLAHVMSTLNTRYDYGLDLFLLSIDEGITGYRDDSLEASGQLPLHDRIIHRFLQTVKQNQIEYGLPLKILSYDELYGWTMDKIVSQIGKKNNCKLPGVELGRTAVDPEVQAHFAVFSDDRRWIEELPSSVSVISSRGTTRTILQRRC